MLKRERKIALGTFSYIKPYISSADKVLDVGSGTCLVADLINKEIGAEVKCVDVINISKSSKNKPIIFDGKKIPFKNGAFTVVLCCFVLHHIRHHKQLLLEMKRVTSSKVIVLEDITSTIFDRILAFFHKMSSRIKFKSKKMKFREDRDWKDLFGEIGFVLEDEGEIPRSKALSYPISRRMYVLSKGS